MSTIRAIRGIQNDFLRGYDAHVNLNRWWNLVIGAGVERQAKSMAPVLSGDLRRNINWAQTRGGRTGGPIAGRIGSSLRYARRQEWEHRSRAFFMFRAVQWGAREIEKTLGSTQGVELWIGAGGRGGAKYGGNGMSGNPAMTNSADGAFTYNEDAFRAAGGMQGSTRVF